MMQGLPSWLFPEMAQAGGPPALTARMHALLGRPQDRTAGARYGQAPTNPQGEWGGLARMLGMAPQAPAPVGAMPPSPAPPVGMPGMMPPHPGRPTNCRRPRCRRPS
jgi:hypothetical protein